MPSDDELIASHIGRIASENTESERAPPSISLDDLRRAFADAMQLETSGTDAGEPVPQIPIGSIDSTFKAEVQVTPASIVEALLFVGSPTDSSVPLDWITEVLQGMTPGEVERTIDDLNESYARDNHPWRIMLEGDRYSMQLLESVERALYRIQSTPKALHLSQTAIDCLSLIAYQPGITKKTLEDQWGQNAGSTLSFLGKKGLIRSDESGGIEGVRYFTTDRFLDILRIQSLDDLPQGEEL